MIIHELKIWPQYFCRVEDGSKTFEVRVNDRDFQAGDIVVLKPYDPKYPCFVEPYQGLTFKIGYVLPIDNGKVVFSLLPCEESGE